MGALAPTTSTWTTKDDYLLKNALEAGASLESLAKGAVQFSRRFTITELQDRWNSLLYDLNASIDASVRITEYERAALKNNSKPKRTGNSKSKSKENECCHGKRKAESIRRCYYALRKRMCIGPLNPGDLSFLGDSYNIFTGEAPRVNNMVHDPIANHFGLQDTTLESNFLPQVMGINAPLGGFGQFPNELANRLGRMESSEEMPEGCNIFCAVGPNLVCDGKRTMPSDFQGDPILNAPIPDCETSFNHAQYVSTSPTLDWKEIESISVPEIPDDIGIKGNSVLAGDLFCISGDGGAANGTSECNVVHMDHNRLSCDDMKISTDCTEDYLVELTDTLFDFSSEEIVEDAVAKSYLDGLSSLLVNSPYGANDDEMPQIAQTVEEAVMAVAYADIVSSSPEEKRVAGDAHLVIGECAPENQLPTSASTSFAQLPEFFNGVIYCELNIEDPEVPCNDHVVFPSRPRAVSSHRRTQNEANQPALLGKSAHGNQACGNGVVTIKRDSKRLGNHKPASQMKDPQIQLNRTVDEFGVKLETSGVDLLNCTKHPASNVKGPCHSGLVKKMEPSEFSVVRQSGSEIGDKSYHASSSGLIISGTNQEGQAPATFRDQGCYPADLRATEHGEALLSDHSEEQFSESDGDIPCFSDIESMILDMDLGPDDQDCLCSREVARYEHKDAKRAIIRLEQSAHSYMQRAIASHGAFAVLYGRNSKHYIKKPEVLLGRGTDDVPVDIDLGREGRANKISRRQAIIKMDKNGEFYLKNLGRLSIYVNNKEVESGECLTLRSDCLIEIKGMPFIFETNKECVKRYLSRTTEIRG